LMFIVAVEFALAGGWGSDSDRENNDE